MSKVYEDESYEDIFMMAFEIPENEVEIGELISEHGKSIDDSLIDTIICMCIRNGYFYALSLILKYASDDHFKPHRPGICEIVYNFDRNCAEVLVHNDRFDPNTSVQSYQDEVAIPGMSTFAETLMINGCYELLRKVLDHPKFCLFEYIHEHRIETFLKLLIKRDKPLLLASALIKTNVSHQHNEECLKTMMTNLLKFCIDSNNVGASKHILNHVNTDVTIKYGDVSPLIHACIIGHIEIAREIASHRTFEWSTDRYNDLIYDFIESDEEVERTEEIDECEEYVHKLIVIILSCYYGKLNVIRGLFGDAIIDNPPNNCTNPRNVLRNDTGEMYKKVMDLDGGLLIERIVKNDAIVAIKTIRTIRNLNLNGLYTFFASCRPYYGKLYCGKNYKVQALMKCQKEGLYAVIREESVYMRKLISSMDTNTLKSIVYDVEMDVSLMIKKELNKR